MAATSPSSDEPHINHGNLAPSSSLSSIKMFNMHKYSIQYYYFRFPLLMLCLNNNLVFIYETSFGLLNVNFEVSEPKHNLALKVKPIISICFIYLCEFILEHTGHIKTEVRAKCQHAVEEQDHKAVAT